MMIFLRLSLLDAGLSAGRFEIPPPGLACFDEPPFPLPLAGGDDELYSPASCRTGAFDPPSDLSPGFGRVDGYDMEKTIADSKFIAQHVRNKDSFENVSNYNEKKWLKHLILKPQIRNTLRHRLQNVFKCYSNIQL